MTNNHPNCVLAIDSKRIRNILDRKLNYTAKIIETNQE